MSRSKSRRKKNKSKQDHKTSHEGRKGEGSISTNARPDAETLAHLESKIDSKLIRQDHRFFHVIRNYLRFKSAPDGDPKKNAAVEALAWRIALSLVPSLAVATTGALALIGVYLAWSANQLAKQSNDLHNQEIALLKSQTSENLEVETLPVSDNYVHVWSATRYPDKPPVVSRVASFYRFRVTNTSLVPVSLIESFHAEGAHSRVRVELPFFSLIAYHSDHVSLGSPIELPVRLAPQESIEFFAMVPRRVTEPTGRFLMELMRDEKSKFDTKVEYRLFTPNLLQDTERRMQDEFAKTKLGQLIEIQEIDLPHLTTDRGLLYRNDDNTIGFRDKDNNAQDGFVYKDGNYLHVQCTDKMLESPMLTYSDLTPVDETYEIAFQTGSGAIYKTVLRSSETLFGRLTQ